MISLILKHFNTVEDASDFLKIYGEFMSQFESDIIRDPVFRNTLIDDVISHLEASKNLNE